MTFLKSGQNGFKLSTTETRTPLFFTREEINHRAVTVNANYLQTIDPLLFCRTHRVMLELPRIYFHYAHFVNAISIGRHLGVFVAHPASIRIK